MAGEQIGKALEASGGFDEDGVKLGEKMDAPNHGMQAELPAIAPAASAIFMMPAWPHPVMITVPAAVAITSELSSRSVSGTRLPPDLMKRPAFQLVSPWPRGTGPVSQTPVASSAGEETSLIRPPVAR